MGNAPFWLNQWGGDTQPSYVFARTSLNFPAGGAPFSSFSLLLWREESVFFLGSRVGTSKVSKGVCATCPSVFLHLFPLHHVPPTLASSSSSSSTWALPNLRTIGNHSIPSRPSVPSFWRHRKMGRSVVFRLLIEPVYIVRPLRTCMFLDDFGHGSRFHWRAETFLVRCRT